MNTNDYILPGLQHRKCKAHFNVRKQLTNTAKALNVCMDQYIEQNKLNPK